MHSSGWVSGREAQRRVVWWTAWIEGWGHRVFLGNVHVSGSCRLATARMGMPYLALIFKNST